MTLTTFLANISSRYSMKEGHLRDISGLLEGISEPMLDKLWMRFIDTYEKTSHPKRADFYKIMQSNGISKSSTYYFYYQCKECGSKYSCISRTCPKCRSRERTLHQSETLPAGYMQAHRDCAECKLYDPGKYCSLWGKSDIHFPQKCKNCKCRACCENERLYRDNYPEYKKKRNLENEQDIENMLRFRRRS